MPRRIRGLGGGSKVPLRGFTQLLQNLDPAVKSRLTSAFADAENLSNFHLRTVPDLQSRRNISGRIGTIELFGEANLLGGFLSWDRLDDPRISFYEIQIANSNVFSSPDTQTTFENFFVLENIRTTQFARVRGVQGGSGDVGLWSNTVTLRPRTSAPEAFSIEFYQGYEGVDPTLTRPFVYSGGVNRVDPHPEFYSVLSKTFYADLVIGGISVWGYISSRLNSKADGGKTIWDRVRFRVNGLTRMDGYFPHWSLVPTENDFHENQRDSAGLPMSFYAKGGYTAAFGPYAVTLPNTLAGEGPNDPHRVVNIDALDSHFYWSAPGNAVRASRFDEAQLPSFDFDQPAHEASVINLDEGDKTDWLVFQDFKFNVAPETVITGIKADLKRRHVSPFNNPIEKDNGLATQLMPLFSQKGVLQDSLIPSGYDVTLNSILRDVDFGRFLQLDERDVISVNSDSLVEVDNHTVPIGFTQDDFTLMGWINNEELIEETVVSTNRNIFLFRQNDEQTPLGREVQLLIRRGTGISNSHRFRGRITIDGNFTEYNFNNFWTTANEWVHFALFFDHSARTLTLYKDGALFGTEIIHSISTSPPPGQTGLNKTDPYNVQIGNVNFNRAVAGGYSQFALFDGLIDSDSLKEIVEGRGYFDLREPFGRYHQEDRDLLLHYWLYIPDQADIRDHEVFIVDKNNNIRTDLTNQAVTTETWPRLSKFFYTDLRQFGVLPLGVSGGIPHDNHTAIGYQSYGGEFDTWGLEGITGADVNNFYFGFAVRAINQPLNGFPGRAFVDHGKLTVYRTPIIDRDIEVDVSVAAASDFYLRREIFGGLMNVITLGERLVDLPEDC